MALAIIAARQQATLIMVHTKELLYQWQAQIKSFLGVEVGLIGAGKLEIKPTPCPFCIGRDFYFTISDDYARIPPTMSKTQR